MRGGRPEELTRRQALWAGAAGAGLAVGGYLSTRVGTPDADALVDGVLDRYGDRTHALEATLHRFHGLAATRTTERVWQDAPDQLRRETLSVAGVPDPALETFVQDGADEWRWVDRTVQYRHREEPVSWGPVGYLADLRPDWRFEYAGSDTVDGRPAHVLTATPRAAAVDGAALVVRAGRREWEIDLDGGDRPGATAAAGLELHVDADRRFPLSVELSLPHPDEAGTYETGWRFEDLELEDRIDDSTFRPDPAVDGRTTLVRQLPTDRRPAPDLENLTEASPDREPSLPEPDRPFSRRSDHEYLTEASPDREPSLPEPDLPPRFDGDAVRTLETRTDDGYVAGTTTRRWFETEDEQLVVTRSDFELGLEPTDRIGVAGTPVRAFYTFGVWTLEWTGADGGVYRVGSHPDRALLVGVAESIIAR